MVTFVIFIISLVLLALLFVMKSLEIYYGRKIFLENLFSKCDDWLYKVLLKIYYWWSHVNFKNTKLFFLWINASIRGLLVATKRRFDHQQSHFFAKKDHDALKNKTSASFFLKDVSEYKKSLRQGKQ